MVRSRVRWHEGWRKVVSQKRPYRCRACGWRVWLMPMPEPAGWPERDRRSAGLDGAYTAYRGPRRRRSDSELEYGVSKSSRPAKNREARDQFVSPLDVAPFERQATAVYGRLRAAFEKKGQSIGSMDLLIAAHAVCLDVRLITHNVREFGRVPGLRIEDWL